MNCHDIDGPQPVILYGPHAGNDNGLRPVQHPHDLGRVARECGE